MPSVKNSEEEAGGPALFLGLGGIGSRIVDRIAGRAAHLPSRENQVQPSMAFVSIDTNTLDQRALLHIPQTNRLHIGALDKVEILDGYRRSQNQQAMSWLDLDYRPRMGAAAGAGQIRVDARLGFFFHSPFLRTRLTEVVRAILSTGVTERRNEFQVYLFTSLAGGTGSGIFLPSAYMIASIVRGVLQVQPRVTGHLLLSTSLLGVVPKELHQNIHANTYAALKELEHFTKLSYRQVREQGRTREPFAYWHDENVDSIPFVDRAPFSLSFIFDKPASFGVIDTVATVADASFLQIFGSSMAHLASALDNYEKTLGELTRLPGEMRDGGEGFAKNYAAMGAAVVVLPATELLLYCVTRFAAEAMRSQITFGVGGCDPVDDRGRALARLAVNFSDPKFLALGAEGRDRLINQAFLASVQEMARQDAQQGLKDGFWFQLVESTEEGRAIRLNEKGDVERAESLLALVRRKLHEQRNLLIQKVSIKERAFVFHKEGVSQYSELVSRLKEDIRASRVIVERELAGLHRSAVEGALIGDLELNPIAERYLVLRLIEECEGHWIPAAQKLFEQCRHEDINDSKVNDRFEEEYRSLQNAVAPKLFRKGDDAFVAARDEAQEYYRLVVAGSRKLLDTEVQLDQYRELLPYLQKRSRQYARLASRMNDSATELEQRAEGLRRGQGSDSRFALSVEIFETLGEPRRRIWDKVYSALFIEEGRYLTTFDPAVLSRTIYNQLTPAVRADGPIVEKSEEQCVFDLRQALIDLGNTLLAPKILGGRDGQGLDVEKGLTLEARLTLEEGRQRGEEISAWEIETYIQRKFRELSQMSGVLARVRSEEWRVSDDGVKVNRTRQLVHGLGSDADQSAFVRRFCATLAQEGLDVSIGHWHDRYMAVVYDLELPIPLYYFEAVIGQIEESYLRLQRDANSSYPLQTDYHWEETLPNLNPRLSELEGRWTLEKLAEALTAGFIRQVDGRTWILSFPGHKPELLGETLSAALYHFGQYCRTEGLRRSLEDTISREFKNLGPDAVTERRQRWQKTTQTVLNEIARRKRDQRITREDVLDRLVMRLLAKLLDQELPRGGVPMAAQGTIWRDGRQVRIVVENADALQFPADVLALKYAQALHGVDKAVGTALVGRLPDLSVKLPEVGGFCLVSAAPELKVEQVLFIGVKPLRQFRYGEIREFARKVLTILARSAPTAQHIAVTVHGPEQGLDEVESFESEIAGFLDCLSAGTFPDELRQISIVEIQPRRAERLSRLLAKLLKTGVFTIGPSGRPEPELGGTQIEQMRGVGYESENKPLAFVAMPFREDMLDHYEYGIQNAVQTMGFLCERADQAHFTGDILQWVKDRIMRSSVVIADLSFANPNVYLEVGYAWGCGKPTILLIRHGEDLKFDVKGQRCLVYRRIKDLEDSLRKELEALR